MAEVSMADLLRAIPGDYPGDLLRSVCMNSAEEIDRLTGRVAELEETVEAHENAEDNLLKQRQSLRERVAELEAELERAACRAADAESRLEEGGGEEGYALRLFIDGKRVLSHELDRHQASTFKVAANHLSHYLDYIAAAACGQACSEGAEAAAAPEASHSDREVVTDGGPAPAGGWLNEEERAFLSETIAQCRRNSHERALEGNLAAASIVDKTCRRLESLLARLTPPEAE